ncbi:hypothetical protein N7527_004290 [Penicillium freii]|nr:hypothetical protein N7527_004290 [Penicillium freii]
MDYGIGFRGILLVKISKIDVDAIGVETSVNQLYAPSTSRSIKTERTQELQLLDTGQVDLTPSER